MAQKIEVNFEEKVGFPNYSNVTYGARLTRDIPDDADVSEEMRKAAAECEVWLGEYRTEVDALLKQAVSK
jgi:hypothetical protein